MEDHKDGMKELLESDHFHFKIEVGEADAEGFKLFAEAHGQHVHEGPDVLTIATPLLKVTLGDQKVLDKGTLGLNFGTTFAPGSGTGQDLRCVIAGEVTVINALDMTPEDWRAFADRLTERNAALGLIVPEPKEGAVPVPYRAEYYHMPGRLFDTPRNATAQGNLPAIERWFRQTAFNRTVGMAAAALTKTDTREAILDWQSATVEEVADLVFCRSEEGTAHGQNRENILKAFEALRAIPVPIVKIDWKQVGTDRNPRCQGI